MKSIDPAAAAGALAPLGLRLPRTLPALRVTLCSIHDQRGDVLWLSDGCFGPDEHGAVRGAFERFASAEAPDVVLEDLGDGRCAAVLQLPRAAGQFAGAVALLVDARAARAAGAAEQFRTAAVTEILREIAAVPGGAAGSPSTAAVAHPSMTPPRPADAAPPAAVDSPSPQLRRLHRTLSTTGFDLHVQQLVPLQAGLAAQRYEVLLRAGAGSGRRVAGAPAALLARATEAGLATLIDRRVVTRLLGWLGMHRQALAADHPAFSVNLSAAALRDAAFGAFLNASVREASLPPGVIAFEVSEQACLNNPVRLVALAALLERLDCPLVIDDFSGSARALELLRTRGVRMLKLAATVTADVAHDEQAHPLILRVVQAARLLGAHTVAKRVTDPKAPRVLAALGVGFVQSFSGGLPCALDSLIRPAPG